MALKAKNNLEKMIKKKLKLCTLVENVHDCMWDQLTSLFFQCHLAHASISLNCSTLKL